MARAYEPEKRMSNPVNASDLLNEPCCCSAFLRLAQLGDHGEILKRGGIALDFAVRGQLPEQAPHDLAAAGLRQALGEADIVRTRQGPDLLGHPFAQFI